MSKELAVPMNSIVPTGETTGPGNNSPMFYEGVRSGLTVRVVPVLEHVCGYVKLPEGHPWLGLEDLWDIPARVHGGISYVREGWIGFDTAHGYDIWPSLITGPIPAWKVNANMHEWTAAEFVVEIENLAEQAAQAFTKELDS
jgi:hypothetical protein